MRKLFVCIALVSAMVVAVRGARAQSLAYSFEDIVADGHGGFGPDGYFGLGATVSQSTIGVTEGDYSMKYEVGAGGFVGARTEAVIPADLNDPPGVKSIKFDFTLTEPYAHGFGVFGISMFGHQLNHPGGATFGNQIQFLNEHSFGGFAAGTYTAEIDLDFAVSVFGFGKSFDEIFGPGPLDLTVASGFQIYINKDVLTPVTLYIDNVRLVVPEPATGALFGLGAIAFGMVVRRRR